MRFSSFLVKAILTQRYNKKTKRKEWALVSRHDRSKVLKWFGTKKPSKEAVDKEERRVQFFKHQGIYKKHIKATEKIPSKILESIKRLAEDDFSITNLRAMLDWYNDIPESVGSIKRDAKDTINSYIKKYKAVLQKDEQLYKQIINSPVYNRELGEGLVPPELEKARKTIADIVKDIPFNFEMMALNINNIRLDYDVEKLARYTMEHPTDKDVKLLRKLISYLPYGISGFEAALRETFLKSKDINEDNYKDYLVANLVQAALGKLAQLKIRYFIRRCIS